MTILALVVAASTLSPFPGALEVGAACRADLEALKSRAGYTYAPPPRVYVPGVLATVPTGAGKRTVCISADG